MLFLIWLHSQIVVCSLQEQQHSAAELAAAKQLAAANEQQLQNDAALREEELGREIVDLKEQVAVVLEYKAKRQFVEDEFAALRQENERLKAELASQVCVLMSLVSNGVFRTSQPRGFPACNLFSRGACSAAGKGS